MLVYGIVKLFMWVSDLMLQSSCYLRLFAMTCRKQRRYVLKYIYVYSVVAANTPRSFRSATKTFSCLSDITTHPHTSTYKTHPHRSSSAGRYLRILIVRTAVYLSVLFKVIVLCSQLRAQYSMGNRLLHSDTNLLCGHNLIPVYIPGIRTHRSTSPMHLHVTTSRTPITDITQPSRTPLAVP